MIYRNASYGDLLATTKSGEVFVFDRLFIEVRSELYCSEKLSIGRRREL